MKKYLISSAVIVVCVAILFFYKFIFDSKDIVLEFAMFNGSNWDVEIQDSYKFIDRAIERFEKEHKGVKIHYVSGIPKDEYSEYLSSKILQGKAPDIMMIKDSDFNTFVNIGSLENLNTYISNEGKDYIEKYYKTALKSGQVDNIQYALPFQVVPYLMFVNKTLLDKEDIDLPKTSYTFDDLYRICKKVTKDLDGDGIIDQFGIFNYTWQEAAVANGANLFSDDGKKCNFNSKEVLEAVRFTKKLNDLSENVKLTKEDFDSGKVAFMPLSYAEYRTYKVYPYKIKKYTNFMWDCMEMPRGASGDNISMVDSLNLAISSTSKNKKMAWEFLKYMTANEKNQEDMFNSLPAASVLKNISSKENLPTSLDNKFIEKIIDRGSAIPKFEKYDGAMQIADSQISKIYGSDVDLDSILRLVQRKVSEFILE